MNPFVFVAAGIAALALADIFGTKAKEKRQVIEAEEKEQNLIDKIKNAVREDREQELQELREEIENGEYDEGDDDTDDGTHEETGSDDDGTGAEAEADQGIKQDTERKEASDEETETES